MSRPPVMLAALLLLGGSLGCRPAAPDESPRAIVARLLPPGEPTLVERARFWREAVVDHWSLQQGEEAARWIALNVDDYVEVRGGGLELRSSSFDPYLIREGDLDASRIDAVRVRATSLYPGSFIQLFWAPPGVPFTEERAQTLTAEDPTGKLLDTFTFPVGDHELWSPPVGRIRLDPTSVPDRKTTIYDIETLSYELDPERLAAVLDRPWLVDLRGDVRPALLAVPDHPVARRVSLPSGARLSVGLGLDSRQPLPVRFRLTVHADGEPATVLLDEWATACTTCGWREKEVDLSAWGGRDAILTFSVEADARFDPMDGVAAWATPVVTAPLPSEPPPNLVVVVLDTLRADHLSLYGYGRPTSPNLDAWAGERATVFETAVAPAPWTLPSHVSLFTGLDALSHGSNTGDPVPASLDLLAERLTRAGYATAAVTGGGYLSADFNLLQGFDLVDYWYEPRIDDRAAGNDLPRGVDRAVRWLRSNRQRPFFLFFHSYETHTPYRARSPFFEAFGGRSPGDPFPPVKTRPILANRETGWVVRSELVARSALGTGAYDPLPATHRDVVGDLYDSQIAYADLHVARLLGELDRLGLTDDTVVVVTSDHGESLGEEGLAGHAFLNDWELLVPLLIAAPGLSPGQRIPRQVGLVDVYPTVLELLGLDLERPVDGRSLVASMTGGPGPSEPHRAWLYASSSNFGLGVRIDGRLKYTRSNSPWSPGRDREELFALAPGVAVDGGTRSDLRTAVASEYERRIPAVRVRIANRDPATLEFRFHGRLANALRFKMFPSSTVTGEVRSGVAIITVPEGAEATAFLEGELRGELGVAVGTPGAPDSWQETVDLGGLTDVWRRRHDGASWVEAEPTSASSTIEIWSRGLGAAAEAVLPPRTNSDLEALGYLP